MSIVTNISWQALKKGALLGNGSYGDVYRGTWEGKEIAIKELLLKKLSDQMQTDFNNETQIMAACQSERIVRLFGVCLEVGHYAIVMEYMPKGSLYQFLQDPKNDLPWTLRWRLSIEIGEGVNYLHQKEIIHRDLKSLNVLLDSDLHAKISDFGLSKVKLETSSTSTTTRTQAGTVRWKAPELFKRKAVPTKASDVYSYGMVLWEITSRQIPFKDATSEVIAMGWIERRRAGGAAGRLP